MTSNQKIVLLVLTTILVLCLAVKIDPVTADIGRHIKNGEIILTGSSAERSAVLSTNFYSYTEGTAPFVNHHWFSGVIFFLIFSVFGFYGLSILYILCMVVAFWLIYNLVRDKAGPLLLFILSLLSITVIASRAEVRPEVFSYLLTAIFIWICVRYTEGNLDKKWIWSLPVLQLLWVNLHIGFVFGPFIIGVFLLSLLVQKDFSKAKYLGQVLFVSCFALLFNPAFIAGAIYPFNIFSSYSYRVFENQSISFLDKLGVGNPFSFFAYKALLILALTSSIVALRLNWKKVSLPFLIFSAVFGTMGWLAIRDFPLFGLVNVIVIILNLNIIHESGNRVINFFNKDEFIAIIFVLVAIVGAIPVIGLMAGRSQNFGIGVWDGASAAAEFFKEQKIKGPIFNNYDIGGYLIFNLFPKEKVFFDNRPETYSEKFVNEEYIPAMEDPSIFKKLEEKYHFNAIFFYYRDYTPWGQAFITQKIFDSEWAPVFVDAENIILLKRNIQNASVISAYEIQKESFTTK
ncbi:MAG: hypothetical protein V1711_02025 [bacterium]